MNDFDLSKDIHSLSDFKRHTSEFILQLKKTGHPLVLTINGSARLVVQDAEAYQRLLEIADRAEAIEGIRRGLADMRAGRSKSLEQFDKEMRERLNIPRDDEL